ncbi:flagellar biosynthetic protein FliR [uncultured Tateyamaria sp.]|uniref:EscT/YscT/HrcT family type III secretion system export apparatus protein n=1 Tax=uncultured Tateyamaria sp. TaxID=455651 RepID=UPI00260FB509|nr:flagellar biosynthetic protein FliR [uncultured Tateyamaria sp.]
MIGEAEGIDFGYIDEWIASLVLVSARITAFLQTSPFFNNRAMPRIVRAGLILALGTFIAPGYVPDDHIAFEQFLSLVVKEAILGFVLGVMTWLPIRGLELSGVILDTQRGSTTAEDFDVIFNAQTTPTALFLSQVFSGFFFASGGLVIIHAVIFDSLEIWSIYAMLPPLSSDAAYVFLSFASRLFVVALLIALPIAGFMFIADVVIAIISKSAPSLNAMAFGMPIKSIILVIMLIYFVDLAYPEILKILTESLEALRAVFQG